MRGSRRLTIVAAMLTTFGSAAAVMPSGSGARDAHMSGSPTCLRSQLRLSASVIEGETQSIGLAASFVNESGHACALDGRLSMTIQQDVNGHWQTAKVNYNPNGHFVTLVLPREPVSHQALSWFWLNWCGAANAKLRLLARYGSLEAISKLQAAGPFPGCGDSSVPSTLVLNPTSVQSAPWATPACKSSKVMLGQEIVEGATQNSFLNVSVMNKSGVACTMTGPISLTIQLDLNGDWRMAKITHNPNAHNVAIPLVKEAFYNAGVAWRWQNWCGGRDVKFRFLARYGSLEAISKPLTSAEVPVCSDSREPSTLTFAYSGN